MQRNQNFVSFEHVHWSRTSKNSIFQKLRNTERFSKKNFEMYKCVKYH